MLDTNRINFYFCKMGIHKRLADLLAYLNETATSFAEKMGIQRSSLSHLLSARNKPSIDFLEKLHHVYPNISLKWFISGEGEMLMTDTAKIGLSVENKHKGSAKKIKRIVCFYEDGTFETFDLAE